MTNKSFEFVVEVGDERQVYVFEKIVELFYDVLRSLEIGCTTAFVITVDEIGGKFAPSFVGNFSPVV